MKLLDSQTDEASLARLGEEAIRHIKNQNYHALADRFGYALAFDRAQADAIQTDLLTCLSQSGVNATVSTAAAPEIAVKFFQPNGANLFAVVECTAPLTGGSGRALVELIVTSTAEGKHVCLEQISYAA
jgi:hypothetical protein